MAKNILLSIFGVLVLVVIIFVSPVFHGGEWGAAVVKVLGIDEEVVQAVTPTPAQISGDQTLYIVHDVLKRLEVIDNTLNINSRSAASGASGGAAPIAPTQSGTGGGQNIAVSQPLKISVSPVPVSQTVVGGVNQFTFANYLLNAVSVNQSVRITSLPLWYSVYNGAPTNLTSCRLYDGANAITTGGNIVNPTAAGSAVTFTIDGAGVVVQQGAIKTISLKCNVAGGITGAFSWGIQSTSTVKAAGATSGQAMSVVVTGSPGQTIVVVPAGDYFVTDDSTPGYRIVNSGATGMVLTRLKFSAQNEAIDIQRVRFQLSNSASNTPMDLVNQRVTLYDEANPFVAIGTAQFGQGDFASSTIFAPGTFRIPNGGSKTMLVKGDIAQIGTQHPLDRSGDLLKTDYDGTVNGIANGGNYGTGVSSGANIAPSSSDTTVQGVRIMKSYPIFTKLSIPTNVLTTGANKSLYRFSVQGVAGQGVAGNVRLGKITFNISSSTVSATTSKYSLFVYTDSAFSQPDTSFSGTGLLNASQCYGESNNSKGVSNTTGLAGNTDIEIFPTNINCLTGTTTYRIPGGATTTTRYFDFKADVANVETATGTENIIITVRGDAAFPTGHQSGPNILGEMGRGSHLGMNIVSVDSDVNDDLIWSPQSTTTAPMITDFDFTNGFQVLGLPASDMPAETLTSPN